MSTQSTGKRVTQRAPRSCMFCAQRKLRCSKSLPCVNCVDRGAAARCCREDVTLSSQQRSPLGRPPRTRRHSRRPATTAGSTTTTAIDPAVETPNPSSTTTAAPVTASPRQARMDNPAAFDSASPPDVTDATSTAATEGDGGGDVVGSTPEPVQDDDNCERTQRRGGTASVSISAGPWSCQSDLAVEAAMSLESLAWGNHPPQSAELRVSPVILALVRELNGLLDASRARRVVRFHQKHVAWMHNVVYMPFFVRECDAYLSGGLHHQDAAWLSLYLAVLCTGVYYMGVTDHAQLGLVDGYSMAKRLYEMTVEVIMKSDFMVVQSLQTLQAICVLVLCSHAFGDTRRIKVLLACANTMAQNVGLRLHRLDDDVASPLCAVRSFADQVHRQVSKRVWCFLCTQDWYLIASKKSYAIVPEHGTTSTPANCREDFDDATHGTGTGSGSSLEDLPLSVYTQSTYMLFLFRLTSIYRALFDRLSAVAARGGDIADSFDCVLAADGQLEASMGAIEQASTASRTSLWAGSHANQDQGHSQSRHLAAQWRALVITSWHQRVMIHRSFFCRSFQDKRYHYSRFVCLAAARKILRSYLDAAATASMAMPTEIWTIPTHAISACIIITLNALFTAEQYTLEKTDLDLMYQCLAVLRATPRPNSIVTRGIEIVRRLVGDEDGCSVQGSSSHISSSHSTGSTSGSSSHHRTLLGRFRKLDPYEIAQLAHHIDMVVPPVSISSRTQRSRGELQQETAVAASTTAVDPPSSVDGTPFTRRASQEEEEMGRQVSRDDGGSGGSGGRGDRGDSVHLADVEPFGDDDLFMPWFFQLEHETDRLRFHI